MEVFNNRNKPNAKLSSLPVNLPGVWPLRTTMKHEFPWNCIYHSHSESTIKIYIYHLNSEFTVKQCRNNKLHKSNESLRPVSLLKSNRRWTFNDGNGNTIQLKSLQSAFYPRLLFYPRSAFYIPYSSFYIRKKGKKKRTKDIDFSASK